MVPSELRRCALRVRRTIHLLDVVAPVTTLDVQEELPFRTHAEVVTRSRENDDTNSWIVVRVV
jgi:hypothetical protein